jgi:4-oxalocrotonate tautomerase
MLPLFISKEAHHALVRIAYSTTLSLASGSLLSSVVQRCLSETFNVPQNDVFHIVTEHEIGRALICTPEFLGISHGSSPVFIQITCSEGRSVDQKKPCTQRSPRRSRSQWAYRQTM